MEEDFVIRTDIESLEDVRSLVLSEIGGRLVGSTEEVIVGSAGFHRPVGTRNPTGKTTDRPLRFGENQRAHEVVERIDVAAVREGRLER